ncbi:MAG: hypothetical protein M3270_02130 [Thermoproteota archaeon]|nr:hypothetical protein [Thermoproteota archaeon]
MVHKQDPLSKVFDLCETEMDTCVVVERQEQTRTVSTAFDNKEMKAS